VLKCHENSKRRPQRPHASGHSFFQGLGSTISHPEAKTPRSHRSRANSEPKEHGVLLRQFGATVRIGVFPGLPGQTFMRSGFFVGSLNLLLTNLNMPPRRCRCGQNTNPPKLVPLIIRFHASPISSTYVLNILSMSTLVRTSQVSLILGWLASALSARTHMNEFWGDEGARDITKSIISLVCMLHLTTA